VARGEIAWHCPEGVGDGEGVGEGGTGDGVGDGGTGDGVGDGGTGDGVGEGTGCRSGNGLPESMQVWSVGPE